MEPLPPVKEVEYRCIIGKLFDELAGAEFTTFSFETAKEFSNFRYEIAVRYRVAEFRLEFRVLGMTATRTMMPAFGTAKSVLKLPHLPFGVYEVIMIKSDGTENMFSIELGKKGFQILAPVPRKRFIDLVIDRSAQVGGGKNFSTISKTPPPPLIPRTIQKRQPPPPTPEELAILESLKSETPEERDAREERELFGGSESARAKKEKEKEKAEAAAEAKRLAAAAKEARTPPKVHAQKPAVEQKPAFKAHYNKPIPKKSVRAAKPAVAKKAPPKPAAKPAKPAKAAAHKPKPPVKKPMPAKKAGKKK